MEIVEPVGERVLIRKDEDKDVTKGGIHLPKGSEKPVLTARIVEVSHTIENNPDYRIQKYDKVLVNPQRIIPVEIDPDNKLFVLPVEDIVAVFRKGDDDG